MADDLPRLTRTGRRAARRGALGDTLVPGRYGSNAGEPGITLSVVRPELIWLVRGPAAAVVPDRVGEPAHYRSLQEGSLAYYPSGPRQWTVLGWGVALASAKSQLEADCPGARYFDVTEGRTLIQIAGPDAAGALTKGCPFDLTSLPVGAGVGTVLGELNALVLRGRPGGAGPAGPDPSFTVIFPRTYAVSGYQWLLEASLEFGAVVEEDKTAFADG